MSKGPVTVTCPCGKQSSYARGTVILGNQIKQTGFELLLDGNMKSLWLCPDCARKLTDIAGQLLILLGWNRYIATHQLADLMKKLGVPVEEDSRI